ncbi:MAG TPA: hypothetical protein PKY82_34590, partial [Pyrinomonadaceae bacterium]|nr:hypothetical protein [Pyrinomonadaceae bacterium]
WGIVIGEKAQNLLLKGVAAVGIGLFAIGTNAAFSFVRPCGLLPGFLCEQKVEKVEKTNESRKF